MPCVPSTSSRPRSALSPATSTRRTIVVAAHCRVRPAQWLVGQRDAVVRALAQLEVRHGHGCGAREGARRPCAREPAQGGRRHGVRTLSYSKAREITRIANAATEDYLLMIAEHGTAAHVEKLVRAYRRCQEAEELSREARQQENRCVSFRYDDDGSLILTCRLPAEAGARVMKALDLAVEQLRVEDVPAGTSPASSLQPAPRRRPRSGCRELPGARSPGSPRHRSSPDRGACGRRDACATGRRVAASSSMALRWPPRPRVVSPATPASST